MEKCQVQSNGNTHRFAALFDRTFPATCRFLETPIQTCMYGNEQRVTIGDVEFNECLTEMRKPVFIFAFLAFGN